jgi:BirA family biotin operon repressor/biotin-[acetyl-CoA-carboxylase] ligase
VSDTGLDRAGPGAGGTAPGGGSRERLSAWDGTSVDELAAGWGAPLVEAYASIGSTNDRAAELAATGAAAYTVVLADEQTAGRGRRGARWWSPPGHGLLMSVVVRSGGAADVPVVAPSGAGAAGGAGGNCLPLVVGLSVAEAVERLVPEADVRVKWPNDLLLGRRKLGGILCEASGDTVVVGIGLNLLRPAATGPDPVMELATSLEEEGFNMPLRKDLAAEVLGRIRAWIEEGAGALTPGAHAALRARDALLDRRLRTPEHGEGTGRGIERDGALVLELPDGAHVRMVAGSVSLVGSVSR